MTQLKCPECGKEFDDTKQACPNCGCPVSLMEKLKYSQQSKIQSRMVAIAKPIGTLSLMTVFFIVFGKLLSFIDMGKAMVIAIDLGKYLGIIVTFVLLLIWFLSLSKGSAKKSMMKVTSIIAIIGICCILLFFFVDALASLTIDYRGQRVVGGGVSIKGFPTWIICWTICNCGMHYFAGFSDFYYDSINLLQFLLIGCSFCALSKYFQEKMRVYGILIGVGFLLRWLLFVIEIVVFFVEGDAFAYRTNIQVVIDVFCFISMALFFFGFSKIYKS